MLLDEGNSDIMNNNNNDNNDSNINNADAEPSQPALTSTQTSGGNSGNPGGGGGGGSGVGNTSVMSPTEYVHPDLPDTKEGIEELCPVCGDKVSGYHYGLLTCESCKGFFKRTVQNKKVYTCVAERGCHIDKSQRKRCPFCRFQKCLDVGMKLEAVRADRMRGGRNKFGPMYKRDRARKLQLLRQKQLAANQARQSCLIGNEVVGSISTGGGGMNASLSYSTGPGTPSLYGSPGGNGNNNNNGVQIKQELIQIPQLSSSTSSPDSSPSPLPNTALCGNAVNGPVGSSSLSVHSSPAAGNPHHPSHPAHHPSSHPSQAQTPSSEHHKMSWTPHTPSTPTSSTPSPHTASPKAFQYEVAVGQQSSSAAANVATAANNSATGTGVGKIPLVIRDIQCSVMDDKEWQSQLFGLLQNQTYNQCEVDLFELMCKVLDQSLFAQVDWARNSIFFKDLKVDDQMKLLQHSWSDMLILDHVHHRLHNNLPDEATLPNGQKFNLLALAVLGVPTLVDQFNDLRCKLQELKFDSVDYICLKFMLLLNPDVRALVNRKHIVDALDTVKQGLMEYNINCYPQIQDKFGKLLTLLPDIHHLSHRGEEHLYYKHLEGGAPTQTLLMEMLHAKKK